MAIVLGALLVGDSPMLFANYRVQTITLDAAIADEPTLINRVEELLGARVHKIKVRRLDLVEATTTVEARYELRPAPAEHSAPSVMSVTDGAA